MKAERKPINLERKLIVSFLLAAIIPILLQYLVYEKVMDMQYDDIRDQRFGLIYHNIITALDTMEKQLLHQNSNFANGAEMYAHIKNPDQIWFDNKFDDFTSAEAADNIVYVLDTSYNRIFTYNTSDNFIGKNYFYIKAAMSGNALSTLANVKDKLYVLSFAPINNPEDSKEVGGVLVTGAVINNEILSTFPKSYNFNFDILIAGTSISTDKKISNYTELIRMSNSQLESTNELVRYYKLYDKNESLVALLEVNESLDFMKESIERTQKGSVLVIGTTLMLVLLFVTLLKNNIMRPIRDLRNKVRQMRRNMDHDSQESDEILALTEEFAAMSLDISQRTTEIEEQNKMLQYLVYKDDITGAYNKRYFRNKLKEDFDYAVQNKKALCLALIDIDHFKMYRELININDRNEVLSMVYSIISRRLNQSCTICFDGTDEFRILMVDMQYKEAIDAISDISTSISQQHFIGMEQLPQGHLTVSCGVANYPKDAEESEKLYYAARDRLHRAKNHSKGNVGYFYTIFNDIKEDIEADRKTLIYASKAFLAVIDAMDEYTYTHTEGVVKYACLIAEKLELDKQVIEDIRIGALLHDIGKLELGRELLNKKERLSDEEIYRIKQHPVFGVNMLKTLKYLEGVSDIVKYHHERFDGKGYPEGLAGESIPLGARIVAVADSFDAMTTTRAYKNGQKSYEEAVEELIRCKGAQFDPGVVDVFACYIKENGFDFRILK